MPYSLFTKQNLGRILDSLLIALSFTSPLESKHVKSVLEGFVFNERFYINNQKTRGWLKGQEGLLVLTAKARRRVQSCLIECIRSKGGGGQIGHEVLLIRCLFLILIYSDFAEVVQIKKQKQTDNQFVHDLSITTQTETLFIEVDRGTETNQTLQSKIHGFQARKQGTLIYFTKSLRTYSQFCRNPDVQFIYLKSQTLRTDILGLTSKTEPPAGQFTTNQFSKATANSSFSNVFLNPSLDSSFQKKSCGQDAFNSDNLLYYNKPVNSDESESDLSQNLEKRRSDLIKLLLEDY